MKPKQTTEQRRELKAIADRFRATLAAIRAGRPEHLRASLEELARIRLEYAAAAARHRGERVAARSSVEEARRELRSGRAAWPAVKRQREATARALLLGAGSEGTRAAAARLSVTLAALEEERGAKARAAAAREAAAWGTPKWGTMQARKSRSRGATLAASEFRQVARDSFLSRVQAAGGDVGAASLWVRSLTTEAKRKEWLRSPGATRGKWGPDYWGERLWELWEEDPSNRGATLGAGEELDDEYRRWAEEQEENARDAAELPAYHPQGNEFDLAEWLEEYDE